MSLPYRLTEAAKADLDEVWDYIADASFPSADQQIDRIIQRIELLCDHPRSGRSRPEFGRGVRSAIADKFVIFYRPEDTLIRVLRIVHGSRDLPKLIWNDG